MTTIFYFENLDEISRITSHWIKKMYVENEEWKEHTDRISQKYQGW